MTQRWPWIAVAVGAYLAFVVSQFPAAAALRWLAPPEFRAAGLQGTVWSGSAALASVPGLPMRELRWTLGRWPILTGRLSGHISARLADGFVDSAFSASLWGVGSGSVTLRNAQLSTSFAALRDVLPVRGARGLLSLDFDEIVLENTWPIGATGSLRISELEVEPFAGAGNTMIELGAYDIDFTGADADAVTAVLADAGGPLEVAGTLRLSRDRAYDLEGYVRARPGAQRELVQGLSIMLPEPDASGRRPFSFPGSL
jgi:general secretion pathway protein N